MASLKDALSNTAPEHILFKSVVGVGRIEQTRKLPSRLNTTGEHIVASLIDAASSGTGTM